LPVWLRSLLALVRTHPALAALKKFFADARTRRALKTGGMKVPVPLKNERFSFRMILSRK
jgi:hypothetical protein